MRQSASMSYEYKVNTMHWENQRDICDDLLQQMSQFQLVI